MLKPDTRALRRHLRSSAPRRPDPERAASSLHARLTGLPAWRVDQVLYGIEHAEPGLQGLVEDVYRMLTNETLSEDAEVLGAWCAFALGSHADTLVEALGVEAAVPVLHHAFTFHWVGDAVHEALILRREVNPSPPDAPYGAHRAVADAVTALPPARRAHLAEWVLRHDPGPAERLFWSSIFLLPPPPPMAAIRALASSTREDFETNLRALVELGVDDTIHPVLMACIDRLGVEVVAGACERTLVSAPPRLLSSMFLAFQWVGSVEAFRAMLALAHRGAAETSDLINDYEESWPAYAAAARGSTEAPPPEVMPPAPSRWEVDDEDLRVDHPDIPLEVVVPRAAGGLRPVELAVLERLTRIGTELEALLSQAAESAEWDLIYVFRRHPWRVGVAGTSEAEPEHGLGVIVDVSPDAAPTIVRVGAQDIAFSPGR